MKKQVYEKNIKRAQQLMSYLLAALILSISSLALAAALQARDLFGEADGRLILIGVLLCALYFMGFLLLEHRQRRRTIHTKNMVRG